MDPIAELIDALERGGKPPLAWVMRWSQGGAEPVAAAWRVTEDGWAMMRLLLLGGPNDYDITVTSQRPLSLELRRPWCRVVNGRLFDLYWGPGRQRPPGPLPRDDVAGGPDALRLAVPTPPTLTELLERCRA